MKEAWRQTAVQFVKFGTVGGFGFIVDSGFLYLGIHGLKLDAVAAAFFSFPFAVSFTWIGNRLFTFRDAHHEPAAKQLTKFAAICAVGLVFNRGTYFLLVKNVPFVHEYWIIALAAGTGVGMFFNFFATRRHVFGV